MKKNQKQWYTSRTLWIAILMGISGVMTAIISEYPLMQGIGVLMTMKAMVDISLRLITKLEIK